MPFVVRFEQGSGGGGRECRLLLVSSRKVVVENTLCYDCFVFTCCMHIFLFFFISFDIETAVTCTIRMDYLVIDSW
jgi:hypothetical protein